MSFEGEYLNGKIWEGKGYDKKNNIIFELKSEKVLIKDSDGYSNKLIVDVNNEKWKGKGKQYDDEGILIFEGEFLYNYKIKGKYYVNKQLEFEGEFRRNKKWNGKGYDENGNAIYELINGNGKVKEYDGYDNLIFEGGYLNGERNGKGKKYKRGKLRFEGEYLNDKRNGKGKEYDKKGNLIFEGEYLNDKRNGKGKEYDDKGNIIYEGEYLKGERKEN